MSQFLRTERHVRGRRYAIPIASLALALLAVASPARALVINATFDSSITTQPNAAAIEGAINAAISVLEHDISTPITVNIEYQAITGGLGQSLTSVYTTDYFDYYNALKAHATSANQLAAIASLGPAPTSPSSGNPVNGNTRIEFTSANGRALGFNTPGGVNGTFDSVIGLNTSITSPPNGLGGNYGLQAVAAHETDEVLGIGGPGSTIGNNLSGPVGVLDLYRYSAPGVRSYSNVQTTSPFAYFSIDGGKTVLSYFSQTAGADYADWLSNPIPTGFQPQVQDAFGRPGTNPALGVNELTALNVIGYGLTPVPEPSSVALTASGALALAVLGRRRRGRKSGGGSSVS